MLAALRIPLRAGWTPLQPSLARGAAVLPAAATSWSCAAPSSRMAWRLTPSSSLLRSPWRSFSAESLATAADPSSAEAAGASAPPPPSSTAASAASKPLVAAVSAPPAGASSPPPQVDKPKSRLAKKQVMTLTPQAVAQLQRLYVTPEPISPAMSALSPRDEAIPRKPAASAKSAASLETTQGKLLRVGTRKKGCSGNTYTLEFVDKPSRFDEQVHQDGVTILIDSRALLSLIGSEMDYLEDPLSSQFVFHNPNVKEMCGCGQSFMT